MYVILLLLLFCCIGNKEQTVDAQETTPKRISYEGGLLVSVVALEG